MHGLSRPVSQRLSPQKALGKRESAAFVPARALNLRPGQRERLQFCCVQHSSRSNRLAGTERICTEQHCIIPTANIGLVISAGDLLDSIPGWWPSPRPSTCTTNSASTQKSRYGQLQSATLDAAMISACKQRCGATMRHIAEVSGAPERGIANRRNRPAN